MFKTGSPWNIPFFKPRPKIWSFFNGIKSILLYLDVFLKKLQNLISVYEFSFLSICLSRVVNSLKYAYDWGGGESLGFKDACKMEI